MGESAAEVASRFDRISDLYDETREPLTEEAFDVAANLLSRDQCRRILEVGVGTGRIAKPFQRRDFEIVGVDFSRGMLEKAKAKGVENLVMGDANHLPIGDKSVDATILAHVLHLLDDPAETFGKLARVTRSDIVAFVRKRDGPAGVSTGEGFGQILGAFSKAAEELGFDLPSRRDNWRAGFERAANFLSAYPPDELMTIQDTTVVTTIGERLALLEKRAYEMPLSISEGEFRTIVERVKASTDLSREIRFPRKEQIAVWRLLH